MRCAPGECKADCCTPSFDEPYGCGTCCHCQGACYVEEMDVMALKGGCVFCEIAAGNTDRPITHHTRGVLSFEPLLPVTPGHILVVPRHHVVDAADDPATTAEVMFEAAALARMGPCNIITSVGAEATQSIFHLHVHVVPRKTGDGLILPWTHQHANLLKLPGATNRKEPE